MTVVNNVKHSFIFIFNWIWTIGPRPGNIVSLRCRHDLWNTNFCFLLKNTWWLNVKEKDGWSPISFVHICLYSLGPCPISPPNSNMASMTCKQTFPDILRSLTCMAYLLGESSSETFSEEMLACTQVKVVRHTCKGRLENYCGLHV